MQSNYCFTSNESCYTGSESKCQTPCSYGRNSYNSSSYDLILRTSADNSLVFVICFPDCINLSLIYNSLSTCKLIIDIIEVYYHIFKTCFAFALTN